MQQNEIVIYYISNSIFFVNVFFWSYQVMRVAFAFDYFTLLLNMFHYSSH